MVRSENYHLEHSVIMALITAKNKGWLQQIIKYFRIIVSSSVDQMQQYSSSVLDFESSFTGRR